MKNKHSLSRRDLFKSAGLAGGLFVAKPLISANELLTSSAQTVGVLAPQHTINSFRRGLEESFQSSPVTLRIEPIDISLDSALEKAQMLVEDDVDYIISITSQTYAQRLQQAYNNIPFFAVNLGEDVINHNLYHDMGLWQANWALGDWAARQVGSRAVIVSSIYDSGYDSFDAFHRSFNAAGGEVLTMNFTDTPDFSQLKREYHPDIIYAAYTGQSLNTISGVTVITNPFTHIPNSFTAQTWQTDAFYTLGYETGTKLLAQNSIQSHPIYLMQNNHLVDELHPVPATLARHQMEVQSNKVGWIHPYLPHLS